MWTDVVAGHGAVPGARWLGAPVLLSLVLHFGANARRGKERPIELLWCCYASSVVLGVSILVGWQAGISAMCVFHVGVGLPMYALDLVAGGTTGSRTVTAGLAHLVAPAVGLCLVWMTGLHSGAWIGAAALLAITQLLALRTDPELNINLVHSPWEPVAKWFGSMWLYRATNLAGASLLLYTADRGLRALVGSVPTGVLP